MRSNNLEGKQVRTVYTTVMDHAMTVQSCEHQPKHLQTRQPGAAVGARIKQKLAGKLQGVHVMIEAWSHCRYQLKIVEEINL